MDRLLPTIGLIALLALSPAVSGCRGDSVQETREHADTGYADIALKLKPDPPVALKNVEFIAEVRDADGAPLEGAEVVLDLSMPGMYHGENRPVANEYGPGLYAATGVLTMGGKWLVTVEVKAPGVDVVKKFYLTAEAG